MGTRIQWLDRLATWSFTRVPGAYRLWFRGRRGVRGEPPFVRLQKPLGSAVIGLVTTGGVHHVDQPPFRRRAEFPMGDGSHRELDLSRGRESLVITHDWYDHADAERDLNLVLPYQRLSELAEEGVIGGVQRWAVGLMGHVEGPEEMRIERRTGPAAARWLRARGADAALLVPA